MTSGWRAHIRNRRPDVWDYVKWSDRNGYKKGDPIERKIERVFVWEVHLNGSGTLFSGETFLTIRDALIHLRERLTRNNLLDPEDGLDVSGTVCDTINVLPIVYVR